MPSCRPPQPAAPWAAGDWTNAGKFAEERCCARLSRTFVRAGFDAHRPGRDTMHVLCMHGRYKKARLAKSHLVVALRFQNATVS